tara:strand:- start:185 stop:847 length:663 start_codon:yes stop_codon:yes gene_type:complete
MKIAICIQGLSHGRNNKGNKVTFDNSYKFLKRNIIDKNDTDLFLHTWGDSQLIAEQIADIYDPVSFVYEKQIMFDSAATKTHSIKSRWYSHMKSVELKKQHEKDNGMIYDFVLVTRFDNCFLTPFSFQQYDNNCFYSSNWKYPHNVDGFLDYWFLSDSTTADKFCSLYEKIDDYAKEFELSNHTLSKYHADKLNLNQKYIKEEYIDFGLERCLSFPSNLF